MINLPYSAVIHEIGPRDGFQNIKRQITTEDKLAIIHRLAACGFPAMQITSFVHPYAVPQMSDAELVAGACVGDRTMPALQALVPNLTGVRRAYEAGLRDVSFVISVSESHNKSNVGMCRESSFTMLKQAVKSFPDLSIRLDLATVFSCPFEGETSSTEVISCMKQAEDYGIERFCLCDTTGAADPVQVDQALSDILWHFSDTPIWLHFHDTMGMGLANCLTTLTLGLNRFETSIAGLGGCPFAPGASGNLATEDLVHMLHGMGVKTGIDEAVLVDTALFTTDLLDLVPSGHVSTYHRKTGCECS